MGLLRNSSNKFSVEAARLGDRNGKEYSYAIKQDKMSARNSQSEYSVGPSVLTV